METKELNNYKIEFYSDKEYYESCTLTQSNMRDEYAGLVIEIPEELAEKIVDESWGLPITTYKDYRTLIEKDEETIFEAKQSFQTLSDLKYCVVTKIK